MANNTALPSGYDYEFVKEIPDDYNCSICHFVMKNPVQTKCGHQFCKECLQEAIKRNPECPVDREALTSQVSRFEDKAMRRKILSLMTKCPGFKQGCVWQGELRYVENHEKHCDYMIAECNNKSCNVRKPRCEMVRHVQIECVYRMVACPHCENTHVFHSLEEHISQCPKCPVSCSNNCGQTMTREQVSIHTLTECPLTIVPCSYENIGCNFKAERQQLNEHMENHVQQHLAIAVEKIMAMTANQDQTNTAIETIQKQINEQTVATITKEDEVRYSNAIQKKHTYEIQDIQKQLHENPPAMIQNDDLHNSYIWNVKDFSQQLQTAKQTDRDIELYSEPFYTHKYGYKMKLQLDPNGLGAGKGTHVTVFLIVMRGEYDALLTWPFNWSFKLILMDQKPVQSQRTNISYSIHADISNTSFQRPHTDENTGYGLVRFVSHETLEKEKYVVDGGLFVKLELEKSQSDVEITPSTMIQDDDRHYSYIWSVKDFSQQLQKAKQPVRNITLYSEPFYTHWNGYKMKLMLYPNGHRAGRLGTHLSVYLVVMRGEYDAVLTWPFKGKVKFILMDQKPNPSQRKNIEYSLTSDESPRAFQRPIADENIASGFPIFVSQETLETEEYVVDGSLFLKLEIEMV